MLGLEIVSKMIAEGFEEYFYGKKSGLKSWKIFRSFIDIATVLVKPFYGFFKVTTSQT